MTYAGRSLTRGKWAGLVLVVALVPRPAAAAPRVGLAMITTGLAPAKVAANRAAMRAALQQAGVEAVDANGLAETCLDAPRCVAPAVQRLGVDALVAAVLLRVGPSLQVGLRLFDASGAQLAQETVVRSSAADAAEAYMAPLRRLVDPLLARAAPEATAPDPDLAALPALAAPPADPAVFDVAPVVASASAPAEAPPAVVLTPGPDEPHPAAWPAWLAVAGSAALLAGGTALLVAGRVDAARVEGAPDGALWPDYRTANADAAGLSAAGGVGLGLGSAGLVASIAWVLW